jgi:hypothetical protein
MFERALGIVLTRRRNDFAWPKIGEADIQGVGRAKEDRQLSSSVCAHCSGRAFEIRDMRMGGDLGPRGEP